MTHEEIVNAIGDSYQQHIRQIVELRDECAKVGHIMSSYDVQGRIQLQGARECCVCGQWMMDKAPTNTGGG